MLMQVAGARTKQEPCFGFGRAVTRLGRSLFAVAYIRADLPADGERLDDLRDRLYERCRTAATDGIFIYGTQAVYGRSE